MYIFFLWVWITLNFQKYLTLRKLQKCSTFQSFEFWSFEMFRWHKWDIASGQICWPMWNRTSSNIQRLSTAVLPAGFLTRSHIPLEYWKCGRFILRHFIRYEHKMWNVGLGSGQTCCTRIMRENEFRYSYTRLILEWENKMTPFWESNLENWIFVRTIWSYEIIVGVKYKAYHGDKK